MEISLVEAPGGTAEPGQRVSLPPGARAFVQMGLHGPGAPSPTKQRLWLLPPLLYFCGAGYLGCEGLIAIDPSLRLAGVGVALSATSSAFLLLARVRLLRGALADGESCLRGCLGAEVTPAAADSIAALLKKRKHSISVGVPVMYAVILLLAYVLQGARPSGLQPAEIAAVVAVLGSLPVVFTTRSGADFPPEVARVVVVDRVREVCERVHRSTPATADFEGLLADIAEAQTLVAKVSAEFDWPTKLQLAYFVVAGCALVFAGIGPQPEDQSVMWNRFLVAPVCCVLGVVLVLLGAHLDQSRQHLDRVLNVVRRCTQGSGA